jgi:hypothetical protein
VTTIDRSLCSGLCLGIAVATMVSHHFLDSKALQVSRLRMTSRTSEVQASPSKLFDPVLVYSTFIAGTSLGVGGAGGSGKGSILQGATTMFVDSSGDAYVAGATSAADFPVTPGVVQTTNAQQNQVGFLSKISPTGATLIFSTYLDGMGAAASIAIDPTGDIYIVGVAPPPNTQNSTELPLPIPSGTIPFQSSPKGISIVKLNSSATAILNATYFGGSGTDTVTGLAVDASGVYLAGTTTSNDFPTKNPLQAGLGTRGGNYFVAKLNTSLSALIYSTYLGGNSTTGFAGTPSGTLSHGISIDGAGNAYVVGGATAGFPTTSGALQATCSAVAICAFLSKLNAAGSSLTYSTYIDANLAEAVAVDTFQNVYFAGGGASAVFPEVNAFQSCGLTGSSNGFVSEINAAGTLTFSTCLGQASGSLPEPGITDLVLGSSGNIYVLGGGAVNLPLMNPIQSHLGSTNLFVAEINPTTPALVFSSLIDAGPLNLQNFPTSIGVDSSGDVFAAGLSTNFNGGEGLPPTFPVFNALQPIAPVSNSPCTRCTVSDGFVMKIAPTNAPAAAIVNTVLFGLPQVVGTSSAAQNVTVLDMGSSPLTISNATVTGDFSIQNNCGVGPVAAAGGTCTIAVVFTPTVQGTRNGVLTINDSSAGSPHTVLLSGQGVQQSVTISPGSIAFGSQLVNSSNATTYGVTVTNPEPIALQISQIQITGPFSETNNCGSAVAANGNCAITISFSPTVAGPATGILTITDGAASGPQMVLLTGTGVPSLNLTTAPPATVTAGQNATYSLSIGGAGESGTAALGCTVAPAGPACSVPATVSVNGTTATTFVATATTMLRTQGVWYPHGFSVPSLPWVVAMIAVLALLSMAMSQARCRLRSLPLVALLACACGGGSTTTTTTPVGTRAGTYTITVKATLGNDGQSQKLTLIVK